MPGKLLSLWVLIVFASGGLAGCGEVGSGVNFGGAQDIGQFREILDQGGIPGASTLDSAGFFAEHFFELPEPACGRALCPHGLLGVDRDFVRDELGERPWLKVLGVGFNSPLRLEDLPRSPLDVAVVVDTSGSMQKDDKMAYARDGLRRLIGALEPGDRLAILGYAAEARVAHPLAPVDAEHVDAMLAAVDTLQPAGATNLYAGLEAGFLSLLEAAEPGRSSLLVLLSDGNPTAGQTAPAALEEMALGYSLDGVVLSTVSVGEDANPTLMRALALAGGGNHYHLDEVRAISEVFVDELAYFLSIVALDIRVEIRLGEGYGLASGHGAPFTFDRYLNQATVRARSAALASRAGDPGPGEGRRGGGTLFMVELLPVRYPPAGADLGRVAEIHLFFRPIGEDGHVEQVLEVLSTLQPTALPAGGQPLYSDPTMEKPMAALALYRGLYAAVNAASWNYHKAAWLLVGLQAEAEAWNAGREDADIRADVLLVAKLLHNLIQKGADPDKFKWRTSSCASASGRGGLGMLGVLLVWLALRRRRG